MPDTDFIISPDTTTVNVALEPVFNTISSLRLLTWGQEYALDPWVTRTLEAMTPEQLHTHRLVMLGLYYIVNPEQSWPSFPAYLDHLAAQPAIALRHKLLDAYLDLSCWQAERGIAVPPRPTKDELLSSKEAYLSFLGDTFPGPGFDSEVESEAYELINDLPRMQETVVGYLRMMWNQFMADEWLRVQPMLQEAVDAFRKVDLSAMTRIEAAEYIIGQSVEDKLRQFMERFQRIVFVPSPHIGMYQGNFYNDTTLWLTFGARLPAGMHSSTSVLSRAELLVRLSALADDTRLRMMGLLATEGELCAQDIMTRLDLSQSAASRHLKQLSATGYLTERRQENAKCYQINTTRIDDTLSALKEFLRQP